MNELDYKGYYFKVQRGMFTLTGTVVNGRGQRVYGFQEVSGQFREDVLRDLRRLVDRKRSEGKRHD